MKRYLLLISASLLLGACGMQSSQTQTKSVSHHNHVHHKKTKHKNHKMSKQKQKEVILNWENNLFNQLDNYSSTWQNIFGDSNLWNNLQLANVNNFDNKNSKSSLQNDLSKLDDKISSIKDINPPLNLPLNIVVKLGNAKGTLDRSFQDVDIIFSDFESFADDSQDVRETDLQDIQNNITEMRKEQRKFERQLNEVNALYNIPPTHYFDHIK